MIKNQGNNRAALFSLKVMSEGAHPLPLMTSLYSGPLF